MNAYSKDFGLKTLAAIDRGIPRKEVANLFGVSLSTIKRWLKRRRLTGDVDIHKIAGRPSVKGEALRQWLPSHLKSNADLHEANLTGANLRDTDLSGADLSGANLKLAQVSEYELSLSQAPRCPTGRSTPNKKTALVKDPSDAGPLSMPLRSWRAP